jgi:hypothetical protein
MLSGVHEQVFFYDNFGAELTGCSEFGKRVSKAAHHVHLDRANGLQNTCAAAQAMSPMQSACAGAAR